MSTDEAWRQWGEQDPYFAVITNPKFRSANLTDDARKEFFESGRVHAKYVLDVCRREFGAGFQPKRALDFGCGVGRVTLAMAEQAQEVVGLDVSPAMLAEARRNAQAQGRDNVVFVQSDDELSKVVGRFDLVHSFIVFQHIDVPRGREMFRRLVDLVDHGGAGAIHVTYAKAYHAERYGQPPAAPPVAADPAQRAGTLSGLADLLRRGTDEVVERVAAVARGGDPEMQMNVYPLSELFFVLQTADMHQVHARFTDHGGELGVFLFFMRRPQAVSTASTR
jgi:SAM-dependent methyltransferase